MQPARSRSNHERRGCERPAQSRCILCTAFRSSMIDNTHIEGSHLGCLIMCIVFCLIDGSFQIPSGKSELKDRQAYPRFPSLGSSLKLPCSALSDHVSPAYVGLRDTRGSNNGNAQCCGVQQRQTCCSHQAESDVTLCERQPISAHSSCNA